MFNKKLYLQSYFSICLFILFALPYNNLIANSPVNHNYFTNITSGGSIEMDQSICFGETPDLLTSITPASGGNAALPIEYLWMRSVPGVSGWEMIQGATGETYQPEALNQTTAFMRCARRAGFTNYTGETNIVLITIISSPVVTFTNLPIAAVNDEVLTFSALDIPFIQYTWDFGDGNTAMGSTVNHVYEFGGVYTVTLSTLDNFTGCSFSISTEIEILGPLPVAYAYFYSEAQDNRAIVLHWATSTEEQNHFFEIQRSDDGINFETIGAINGQGNDTENGAEYRFIDDAPYNGINYYRLKQVDYSGEFAFSETVSTTLEKEGTLDYSYFPNPATEQLSVRLKDVQEHETIITISDLRKNIISEHLITASSIKADIDISNLAPGTYIMSVNSRRIRSVSMFVKIGL